MKKIAILMVLLMASGAIASPIQFGDNFDGGLQGSWNAKWDANSDQKSLWDANATDGATMLGLAKAQYRAVNQQAFSIDAGETATLSSDFRFTSSGVALANYNKNFMGFIITTGAAWWQGANYERGLVNRGAALGSQIPVNPWVEGWYTMTSIGGVDTGPAHTPTQTGWFSLTWDLRADETSGTIWGTQTIDNGAGTIWTSADLDLGLAAGTTIYAGYSSGYQNTGTNLVTGMSISEVQMDNFQVDVIPEPATLGLITAFGGAVLFIRRRFLI